MITFQATESDIDSPTHLEKEWLYLRNESIRKEVITEQKRLGKKMFIKILFLKKESCKSKIIFHGVFFFFFFLKMFMQSICVLCIITFTPLFVHSFCFFNSNAL